MDASFVHLHVHSEYSLLDGAQRIPAMVKQAAAMEMPALALSDHGVMYGALDFYRECKAVGVKPIVGVEAYVAPGKHTDRTPRSGKQAYHHLLLLAQNAIGYRNLLKLTSTAATDGYYYKPRIDKELLAKHSEGLIGTTACVSSEVNAALLADDFAGALRLAGIYTDILGRENFFVELQDHGLDVQKKIREPLIRIARDLGLKLVCTNDAHYLRKQDAAPHDVLLCVQTGATINDPDRLKYGSDEFYLKSAAEMGQLFADTPEALATTMEIADRCNLELEFGRLQLPVSSLSDGMSPSEYVERLCRQSLPRLYGEPTDEVEQRLQYELRIIDQTNFAAYFLIVRDFSQFAREKGIFFGVRGSAAGSLVSYCLGITDIDPIEYSLTFERFLNPERSVMPDIDMDFEDTRRDEVIRYVTEKYGAEHVAQIVTFGTMAARGAIRDAGRALGIEPRQVDEAAKRVPHLGMTIDEALSSTREFQELYRSSADMTRLIDTARSIEGMVRNISVHAAGVVISRDPLVEHVPLARGANGSTITQYHADALEKIGLLKMDFLGLSNLSVLARAVENVRRSRGIALDVHQLPLDDAKAYQMLGRGDVVGVFQLESDGMRRSLMELKPQNVRELAAMIALYRPGPMNEIPKYIRAKFGLDPITYLHPSLEPALRETFGVIVFQDQVLLIVQAVAGFTLGQADILRKAMGKKQKTEMENLRARFIEGAIANGLDQAKAIEIFELIEPFAGYAFNKAHATCYAAIAYQTAYLKANYPAEYMAALMAVYRDHDDKIIKSIEECRHFGIEVLPPDINASEADFSFEDGKVRFGLCAIKGVGEAAIDGVLASRAADGPFADVYEFCERSREHASINRLTLESLIKAGAFDGLHENRAQLLKHVDMILAMADRTTRDRLAGQTSLFEGSSSTTPTMLSRPEFAYCDPPTEAEKLAMEKLVMGIYVSGHPLRSCAKALADRSTVYAANVVDCADGDEVVLGGVITAVRTFVPKRARKGDTPGDKMATFTLEDTSGTISVAIFPKTYAACQAAIARDAVVLVKGRVCFREQVGDDGPGLPEIRAEAVKPFDTAAVAAPTTDEAGSMVIQLRRATRSQLERARELLRERPGPYTVYIDLRVKGSSRRLRLPNGISPDSTLAVELEKVLSTSSGNKVSIRHPNGSPNGKRQMPDCGRSAQP